MSTDRGTRRGTFHGTRWSTFAIALTVAHSVYAQRPQDRRTASNEPAPPNMPKLRYRTEDDIVLPVAQTIGYGINGHTGGPAAMQCITYNNPATQLTSDYIQNPGDVSASMVFNSV